MFYQFLSQNESSKTWADVSFFGDSADKNHDSLYSLLEYLTYLVLVPVVSILGLFGNAVSILILYKRGLHKSSNVLIFTLAVADSTYLLGINNIPLKIYLDVHAHYGFYSTWEVSMFLYATFHMFVLLETVGKVTSMILPPLIIVERFVAVFFPLHFSRLVTSARIKAAVTIIFPLGLPAYLFYLPMTKYTYTFDITYNITVGYILKSDTFSQDSSTFSVISEVYTTICGPVCVGFVVVGCVLISAKIKLQLNKRASMMQLRLEQSAGSSSNTNLTKSTQDNKTIIQNSGTAKINTPKQRIIIPPQLLNPRAYNKKKNHDSKLNNEAKTKRTTKILLSVCVVYSITGAFNFLSDMVLNSQRLGSFLGNIFHWASIIALCVNSAANFLIYVALNRNFRDMYTKMFCGCLTKRVLAD